MAVYACVFKLPPLHSDNWSCSIQYYKVCQWDKHWQYSILSNVVQLYYWLHYYTLLKDTMHCKPFLLLCHKQRSTKLKQNKTSEICTCTSLAFFTRIPQNSLWFLRSLPRSLKKFLNLWRSCPTSIILCLEKYSDHEWHSFKVHTMYMWYSCINGLHNVVQFPSLTTLQLHILLTPPFYSPRWRKRTGRTCRRRERKRSRGGGSRRREKRCVLSASFW